MKRRNFLKNSLMGATALASSGLIISPTAAAQPQTSNIAKGSLRFRPDGGFKIVQFTDVHWKPEMAAESEQAGACMRTVLDAEKPDLVILTGDVVYGKPVRQAWDKALAPVMERGIPFAVVLGNHDDEFELDRQGCYDYIKNFKGNLTSTVQGISGVTNFVLAVESKNSDKTAAVLYCIDSNAYSSDEKAKGYDWIKHDQIDWYRKVSNAFKQKNGGEPVPSLAFFHIPLPEYNEAASEENAFFYGIRKEKACAPVINSGMYTAMFEQKDVMGTFVGHDHVNDYLVDWKGIALCYGRYTGGPTVYNDIPRGNGARIIELTEGKRSFKTWLRLWDGSTRNEIVYPDELAK